VRFGWLRLLDLLVVLAAAAVVMRGVAAVPFHPDEAEYLRFGSGLALDFSEQGFEPSRRALEAEGAQREPRRAYLHLNLGPLVPYLIGAAFVSAGLERRDRAGPWEWGRSYAENVALGHRPAREWLTLARGLSVLFAATAVLIVFALGLQCGGRGHAYLASGLLALNPIFLMHARRAMSEAPLLALAALVWWLAARCVRASARSRIRLRHWLLFGIAAGTCVAAKHSGVLFVAAAGAWLACVEWRAARGRSLAASGLHFPIQGVALASASALALFIAIQPPLWSDPIGRLERIVDMRLASFARSVEVLGGELGRGERMLRALALPFLSVPEPADDVAEMSAYLASGAAGLMLPRVIGGAFTVFALVGLTIALRRAIAPRDAEERSRALGWIFASAAVFAVAALNPVPWQRYFLPVVPLACLLVPLGMRESIAIARRARGDWSPRPD
jgi:4-amino-4-deoxy-L-arabinose transferase-like glycosyltransferase